MPIDNNGSDAEDIKVPVNEEDTGSYFKKRLLNDAERVEQKDIDELEQSLPKKLAGLNLKEMGEGMKWINTMLDRVRALYEMIRDKEYEISFRTKAIAAAALIYFVLPTDLTPDFIPGIGYVDDAMVLGILWKMIGEEVEGYIASTRRYFPE